MADERLVVLNRSDNLGFGFSLLGEAGLPHIIYQIEENSPAARSGEVEAGDVLLKVNGTDVNRFTTKEVLKCLRLSSDPVTLRLKKDPEIKANVRRYISAAAERRAAAARTKRDKSSSPPSSNSNSNSNSNSSSKSSSNGSDVVSGDSCEALLTEERSRGRPTQPKFEAYMMTGDLMLNLSRVEHPHHNHHAPTHRTHYHRYNSTPASPSENRLAARVELAQRHNSSPDTGLGTEHANKLFISQPASPAGGGQAGGEMASRAQHVVRTSRSEDHLQKESSLSAVAVDMEEDVTSSLNTLLDARPDSATPGPRSDTDLERDRIVWTYNAPVSCASERTQCNGSGATSNSTSISDGISQRSSSPASPTSVSSSVMSSRATPPHRAPLLTTSQHSQHSHRPINGDMSLSEAVSNISSPDYQDQDDMFDTGRDCPRMELSDPSDSDSTILVSEPCHKRAKSNSSYSNDPDSDVTLNGEHKDYRIVIQVKGPDKSVNTSDSVNNNNNFTQNGKENGCNSPENQGYQELGSGSDVGSDEGSDGDSLHSFHYSPKAVDIPSAERLAKRLYHLDGFKKSDVSRHLSKNNEFSRAVAEEYVKHFSLGGATLDEALRQFLARFALSGETQERERVLVHFSRRYLECNPGTFNSQDAVHTLTCAIMLLNTDLHGGAAAGGAAFRRMTCAEFIDNLADLNDGDNFPRDTLKQLYHAIRTQPLQWALDTEANQAATTEQRTAPVGSNPFLDVPDQSRAVEYKKGYVMRKCCVDPNGKKTPFGRRGWKMFYCTLRDLVLYLHKDEHGFRRSQMSDNLHNAIRIHHALATKATDYTKKQHVFRLQTADQAEYLFQTSDSKELCSWVETINFVCAAYSAPPLAGAVGSQRKFQRPLLPCTHTKLAMREQLADHEERAARLEEELAALRAARDSAHTHAHNAHSRDKDHYLVHEIKRYRTYAYVMRARAGGAGAEEAAPALPERPHPHPQPPP
ncbi:PREDICTED: PH and SEC7 domain-containing protein 3 isoform X2 [Papilio xuthus]|uniref:PH and SEC7 domain-containing protein 3 n=1 Tax=Papilio xuthus TaxID=66420 RepID=A0A194QBG9_PAPXU|nr:PREDICTED: PH and SEC7 domain-containing protein 3 isoform X2 [Papilio xuthus]KPJ02888.1 PH and SEC7 domain-containing protein 3 [Papilio xuthus]